MNASSLKKKIFKKRSNKPLFQFDKFDPVTGEKIANSTEKSSGEDPNKIMKSKSIALMEARADAMKGRSSPMSGAETLKDGATGGSLSFLLANATGMKRKGLIGLAGAVGAGALSLRKQRSEYNRQQAAREFLSGRGTGRSTAYKGYLKGKYNISKNGGSDA